MDNAVQTENVNIEHKCQTMFLNSIRDKWAVL